MAHLLEALNGPLEGSIFVVVKRTIIGRDADVDIQLIQKGVSRQHAAVLTNDDNVFFLMDLASKNGTFLKSESIGRERLELGDRFRVGSTDFLFREGPAPQADGVEVQAGELRLASGPAVDPTIDGPSLSLAELAQLKDLGNRGD